NGRISGKVTPAVALCTQALCPTPPEQERASRPTEPFPYEHGFFSPLDAGRFCRAGGAASGPLEHDAGFKPQYEPEAHALAGRPSVLRDPCYRCVLPAQPLTEGAPPWSF